MLLNALPYLVFLDHQQDLYSLKLPSLSYNALIHQIVKEYEVHIELSQNSRSKEVCKSYTRNVFTRKKKK